MFGKRKDAISVVDELLDAQQLRSLYSLLHVVGQDPTAREARVFLWPLGLQG